LRHGGCVSRVAATAEPPPPLVHLDLRDISAARICELRFVDLEVWCPRERDPRASKSFYRPLHEDFYTAMLRSTFCPHRVCPLEDIVRAGGEQTHPYLTYLPGLADLWDNLGHTLRLGFESSMLHYGYT
jgi:hypothetical protein